MVNSFFSGFDNFVVTFKTAALILTLNASKGLVSHMNVLFCEPKKIFHILLF